MDLRHVWPDREREGEGEGHPNPNPNPNPNPKPHLQKGGSARVGRRGPPEATARAKKIELNSEIWGDLGVTHGENGYIFDKPARAESCARSPPAAALLSGRATRAVTRGRLPRWPSSLASWVEEGAEGEEGVEEGVEGVEEGVEGGGVVEAGWRAGGG